MKTNWVIIPILVGLLCLTRGLSASQTSTIELVRLAESLDELADQQPSASDQIFRDGRRLHKAVVPVPLRTITPVVAHILKIEEEQLRTLLQNKHEKLSRVVYAKMLATKQGGSWKEIVENQRGDLVAVLQKAGVSLQETYNLMDKLYTELAFAALDEPLEPVAGKQSAR